jgi:hypothetical protein
MSTRSSLYSASEESVTPRWRTNVCVKGENEDGEQERNPGMIVGHQNVRIGQLRHIRVPDCLGRILLVWKHSSQASRTRSLRSSLANGSGSRMTKKITSPQPEPDANAESTSGSGVKYKLKPSSGYEESGAETDSLCLLCLHSSWRRILGTILIMSSLD